MTSDVSGLEDEHGDVIHICMVCFTPSHEHLERCLEDECAAENIHHLPALCCPGCGCRSYEEAHEKFPTHVPFEGIEFLIPPPNEGGQGHVARAFGFSRRSVGRWKRSGQIPFYSADKALARIGEHPIVFWPEAYGLPPAESPPPIPEVLRPPLRPPARSVTARVSKPYVPREPQVPKEALRNSTVRVLVAVLDLNGRGGRIVIDQIVEMVGLGRATVWHHLQSLREAGLVDWIDGRSGTLHPTVRLAPIMNEVADV